MDKHFQLGVRAILANLFHLVQRQFARQNHTTDADRFPKLHRCRIHSIGLHREVNFHLRPGFAHHHDETRVGHDHRVWLERNHGRHVGQVVFGFVAVRENVGHQKEFTAHTVRVVNAFFQHLNVAKIIVTHAQ